MGRAPTITRLIIPEPDLVPAQVDNVRSARPIDIRETDALLVELIGRIEERGCIHGNHCTETPIAKVRPVADLTVADPDEVPEAITGHVGDVDRLGSIGKDQGGTAIFIKGFSDRLSGPETGLGIGGG